MHMNCTKGYKFHQMFYYYFIKYTEFMIRTTATSMEKRSKKLNFFNYFLLNIFGVCLLTVRKLSICLYFADR